MHFSKSGNSYETQSKLRSSNSFRPRNNENNYHKSNYQSRRNQYEDSETQYYSEKRYDDLRGSQSATNKQNTQRPKKKVTFDLPEDHAPAYENRDYNQQNSTYSEVNTQKDQNFDQNKQGKGNQRFRNYNNSKGNNYNRQTRNQKENNTIEYVAVQPKNTFINEETQKNETESEKTLKLGEAIAAPLQESKEETVQETKNEDNNVESQEDQNSASVEEGEQREGTEENVEPKESDDTNSDLLYKLAVPASDLLNKKDDSSEAASKPIISIPQKTASPTVDDNISTLSDTETIQSKQTSSTIPSYPQPQVMTALPPQFVQQYNLMDQQRMMYAPYAIPQMLQFPNMFNVPYLIIPQPNGAPLLQPITQFPVVHLPTKQSEDDNNKQIQSYYVIPTNLIRTPDPQEQWRSNYIQSPLMSPQFMPYSPMQSGYLVNPIYGHPMQMQQNVYAGERESNKSHIQESQLKDEPLSDRPED